MMNMQNHKWKTVIELADYSVEWGLEVVINNRRNHRRHPLTIGQMRDYFRECPKASDQSLIQFCIDKAIIPHPIEELV